MKKTSRTAFGAVILLIILSLCSCKPEESPVTDVISTASEVRINGESVDTVEARMGAFEGKQGDYIEFFFDEEVSFEAFFINEKTTSVRQYNIYTLEGDKYKLIHTGKLITIENIELEPVKTKAIKVSIVNTEIGNDNFIIQGISAYNIKH